MLNSNCPCCNSKETSQAYPSFSGTCITSDMMILPDASIANRQCQSCGLIFNAAGTRGRGEAFYRDSYSLMMKSPEASIQSFAGPAPISQAERTHQILREMTPLPAKGRVLEAGAGKGDFLSYFVKESEGWEVHAFEPSSAFETLKERFPKASVSHSDYHAFDAGTGAFDLVVALGVLEHVDNPLDMLRWASARLADGGLFYIRVPNFERNPNDLFCADHLSKLTSPSLHWLAATASFEVVASKEAGVPIFILLRKTEKPQEVPAGVVAKNGEIVARNVAVAKDAMDAIANCRKQAQDAGEPFAIFGLGSSGLFAPFALGFDVSDIAAYLDENRSVWGSGIHGRPVGGLDMIEKLGIRHVALAISPVYFEQVTEKLKKHNVAVYSA